MCARFHFTPVYPTEYVNHIKYEHLYFLLKFFLFFFLIMIHIIALKYFLPAIMDYIFILCSRDYEIVQIFILTRRMFSVLCVVPTRGRR